MSAPEVNANTAVDAPATNTTVQDQTLDTGAGVDTTANTNTAGTTDVNANTGAPASPNTAEKKKGGNLIDKLKTQFEKLTHPNKNKGGADTGATTTSANDNVAAPAGTTEATTTTT
ncbi:hypothetical protein INT43_007058 [Umbelopsis isabellina]|uniref:Uncharacterized protein n=1 Tax=Mortierella isabellina TaxID=91625 RepID=A0A8H7PZT1_MORIS|nr:hypothetical protein INT43_007058 [Umbelopsis isabellina]